MVWNPSDRGSSVRVRCPRALAWLLSLFLLPSPVPGQAPPKRLNPHGEPIPEGAAAVLGTNRYRDMAALDLAADPDGEAYRPPDRTEYMPPLGNGHR